MLAHGFILHEAQGDSADDEPTLSLLFYYCKSALAMIAVIITMLLWWRSTEATRVRKIVRRDGSQILPTPVPVLPRWLGFFGGHTVLINPPKVSKASEVLYDLYGFIVFPCGRRLGAARNSFLDAGGCQG